MKGFRSKLTKKGSKSLFTSTAMKTHRLNNVETIPLRGGIRL